MLAYVNILRDINNAEFNNFGLLCLSYKRKVYYEDLTAVGRSGIFLDSVPNCFSKKVNHPCTIHRSHNATPACEDVL